MSQEPHPLPEGWSLEMPSYEAWIDWVFDHPAIGAIFDFVPDPDRFDALFWSRQTVAWMTRLLRDPRQLLPRFSRNQIGRGLNFLFSSSVDGDHARAMTETDVPLAARVAAIEAIGDLYEKLFAQECDEDSRREEREDRRDLNYICFMLWDVGPWPAFDGWSEEATLGVMRRTLRIPHRLCREAALHGLGHWQWWTEDPIVAGAIDEFLAANPDLPARLRDYALHSRSGDVQ